MIFDHLFLCNQPCIKDGNYWQCYYMLLHVQAARDNRFFCKFNLIIGKKLEITSKRALPLFLSFSPSLYFCSISYRADNKEINKCFQVMSLYKNVQSLSFVKARTRCIASSDFRYIWIRFYRHWVTFEKSYVNERYRR